MQGLVWQQATPCAGQSEGEPLQLLEMEGRQSLQPFLPGPGERKAHDPMVLGIPGADDEAGRVGAIHETHGAVMAQEQIVRRLAHRRSARVRVAANGQE